MNDILISVLEFVHTVAAKALRLRSNTAMTKGHEPIVQTHGGAGQRWM
jgi:hypothetical protein